ncbi:hypothetical protein BHE74_00023917, partial [Ensete ventricosum]
DLGFCCRVGEALKRCRDTCFGRNSGLLAAGSRRCWSSPRGNLCFVFLIPIDSSLDLMWIYRALCCLELER